MRIHLLSDIHMEHGAYTPEQVRADVVVLAGDIDVGLRGLKWAAATFAGTPVVYVPGNHEYYGQTIPRHRADMLALARKLGLHLLDNAAVTIAGVRFLGCTLWTDFRLYGDDVAPAMLDADMYRNDYRAIRVSPKYRRLRPFDTLELHRASRSWLERELAAEPGTPTPGAPTVVVTHHAPTPRSLPSRFDGDLRGASYASDLSTLLESRPLAWMHGHTHHCVDYPHGPSRIISNACGYPVAPVTGFRPDHIIEL